MLGEKLIERLSRPLRTRVAPGGLILGYHRIADDTWDPLGLCTKPQHFKHHLLVLQEYLQPVSLRSLVARLIKGQNTTNMVAVTFDDGYRDFIDHALPALSASGIPATVFITTGNAGRPFWWDQVSSILRHVRPDIEPLELKSSETGKAHVFDSISSSSVSASTVRTLCRELSDRSAAERNTVLDRLRVWNDPVDTDISIPRALSAAEIRQLHEVSGIELASHTVSHPMLEHLSLADQREEIESSRLSLEAVTGQGGVTGFSYPNGSFSAVTLRLLQELGFDYACTSRQHVVRTDSDPFRLPRIWVPDLGENRFRRWLSSWCGIRF